MKLKKCEEEMSFEFKEDPLSKNARGITKNV